jgi:hypothetical protein
LNLQIEQATLKTALNQQAEAQQKMLDDIKLYNEKRDAEVAQLVVSLNAELEQTRVALQDARGCLKGNDFRRNVCEPAWLRIGHRIIFAE